jgi:hypothetical protein
MSADYEWLNLIEVSGPFLAVPVLRQVFPQGLEEFEASKRLRRAYDEWRDAVDDEDADLEPLHRAWLAEVLHTALGADDALLRRAERIPTSTVVQLPEHDTFISPDLVLVDPTRADAPLAVVHIFPPDTDLSASRRFGGLSCAPADRMALHLRAIGLPVGVVTNGERWMMVHAPTGQVATFASWYARIWGQEPETLRAFASLLSVRRFFGPAEDRLPALFERSLKYQDEVTDALGVQVRRAIEVLVQALDRADLDRNRELLRNVEPRTLYDAGLTVMMRLVFLLAAEERGLLLLGDPRYDAFYAVSTLRMQLRGDSDEILERRRSAWSRLLAVFRAVYGGIDHPTLHLPAMGGSLFDPDRFPFLEGRPRGTSWRQDRAEPLPIDDRTVLLLLDAIQTLDGRTLSYRALDVEQVGHVYEGLLERTVARVEDVTLELEGGAQAKEPRLTLGELESARLDGQDGVVSLVIERTKRSVSAIHNALAADVDARQSERLLAACRGVVALRDRLQPYLRLLRTDPWGYPLVYPKGAFVVALGADRRETGTHYTPKSLTERIVQETLTPLVYDGPAKGAPRGAWKLKTPAELLDLKVCDPAMGSGAFLVQACRFLSDRLVEAWAAEEAKGRVVDVAGRDHDPRTPVEALPPGTETRAEHARRMIAERCLHGVDLNPLAVELAKLSLWLVTLSKGRPFGFLDHNLRCGDSLFGIIRPEQLTEMTLEPVGARSSRPFCQAVQRSLAEAVRLQGKLDDIPILDIRDVEAKAAIDAEAKRELYPAKRMADAFIGTFLEADDSASLDRRLTTLAAAADRFVQGDARALDAVTLRATTNLARAAPNGPRHPFHWPLEFPEVFAKDVTGFSAIISNPPWASYSGRQAVPLAGADAHLFTTVFRLFGGWRTLHSLFVERAVALTAAGGSLGFLLPAQVADLAGYAPARQLLRANFRIPVPLPYFGEEAFNGVIQPTCAVLAHDKATIAAASDEPFALSKTTSHPTPASTTHVGAGGSTPNAVSRDITQALKDLPRPPGAIFGDPGIHTGNCSKALILSSPTDASAPVREGKSIHPYRISAATKWVRLDYDPVEGEYFTIRGLRSYAAWPILLRQTASRPIACLHSDPSYFRNSVLACKGLDGVPNEVVVAWLNSSVVAWFHMSSVREANQRVFPQVKVKHLRALPMPRWSASFFECVGRLFPAAHGGDQEAITTLDLEVSLAFGLTETDHEAVRRSAQDVDET